MRPTLPLTLTLLLAPSAMYAQFVDGTDEQGNTTQWDESGNNRNFNKHNTDTTQHKEI